MNPRDYTHKDIRGLENEDLLTQLNMSLDRQVQLIRAFCDEFLLFVSLRGHWMKRAKTGKVLNSEYHQDYREVLDRSETVLHEVGLAFRRGRASEGIEDLSGCIVNVGGRGVLSLLTEEGDRIKLPTRGPKEKPLWDPYEPELAEEEDEGADENSEGGEG